MNARAQISAGFSSAPVYGGGASNALKINRLYTLCKIPDQVRDDAFVSVILSSSQDFRHAGPDPASIHSEISTTKSIAL